MVMWAPKTSAGDREALIAEARKWVSIEPNRAERWIALGNVLIELGRFSEAAECMSEGTAILPEEPTVHLLLADARRRTGDLDAAVKATEIALSLAPNDPEALFRGFDIFVAAHCWDRVALYLDYMTNVAPTLTSVLRAQMYKVRKGGNPQALLEASEMALTRQPSHTEALYHKAIALVMLGRDREACAVMAIDKFVAIDELPRLENADTPLSRCDLRGDLTQSQSASRS